MVWLDSLETFVYVLGERLGNFGVELRKDCANRNRKTYVECVNVYILERLKSRGFIISAFSPTAFL